MKTLIIHGHFYQPPRENPWTGEVEREPSAAPFHDWNERIHSECYAPNAFAHIAGNGANQINNYERISFNFGPTLLSWLERHHPKTYVRIIEADRYSIAARGGHGNAIAQAYGHAILPLCNERDRLTQVLWGLADFRYRFGREPESIWLPETACDDATLGLLIEQNLKFVILAPDQAARYRETEDGEWKSTVSDPIPTSRPYRYFHRDNSGRSLAIFFYDGPLSRMIAFEKVLSSSRVLVDIFERRAEHGSLVNLASDGETYGHHFKFGDLCLAHALEIEAPEAGFWITNYGEYLTRHPPTAEVEISSGADGRGTSWSCAHGVGRWRDDCGCHTGGEPSWNQKWRGPLREALEFLRDHAALEFEKAGTGLLNDPWAARNDYIGIILRNVAPAEFFEKHAARELTATEQDRVLLLLELQRYSLLTFTSCGWFFSELSGIETLQVLKYAARVIELLDELNLPSERERFLALLSLAKSNRAELGTGEDIYLRFAQRSSLVTDAIVNSEAALS